ncbi:DUF1516 family protein [Staphylococcus pseudintermedius]|uniref:DUF1516 family protein n=1 Tax=Staphylococcus pseudintermedius TaxID=283734 RepID=UPI003CD0C984
MKIIQISKALTLLFKSILHGDTIIYARFNYRLLASNQSIFSSGVSHMLMTLKMVGGIAVISLIEVTLTRKKKKPSRGLFIATFIVYCDHYFRRYFTVGPDYRLISLGERKFKLGVIHERIVSHTRREKRGYVPSPFFFSAPGMGNILTVKVRYRLGSRNC